MINREYKPVIQASHMRCRKYGIGKDQVFSKQILDDVELQQKFAEKRRMIMTAAPYMEQLINIVEGGNFFALLTDGEGCILNAIGDEKILGEAFELKMVPGAYMNEESIGTNAMALVIETEEPIQLTGNDHFINAYHRWTCSGAPIKDLHGNLIGALDLTGYTEQVHPHTLGMVIAASNAIEEMLKVHELNELQNTNNKHIKTIFNSMPIAIVTSDTDGTIKIYNEHASQLFGHMDQKLVALDMRDIIKEWPAIKDRVLSGAHIEQEITIIYSGGSNSIGDIQCRLMANPIYNPTDDSVEIVYVFERLRKSVQQAFYTFDKIIGKNENFTNILSYAKKISDSRSTILILGESGTGKEVFAQAIHNYSKRLDGPFLAINCGAIPKQLMEFELFGYEEGTYFGGKAGGNQGKFEQADGGTILLDEIGELPLDMQIKLQRVLQEGIVTRIGSRRSIPVNVRVIATTNKDLKKEVELGRFRKDLFYRLNVLPIYLPPLRERIDDIKPLTDYFMKTICGRINRQEVDIPEESMALMKQYSWPGNIRELENIVELIINTETIPQNYFLQEEEKEEEKIVEEVLSLEDAERQHIQKILNKNSGNISRSSIELGIRRNTLYSKIKKYDLKV